MAIVNDFIHLLDSYYKCCRNSLIKPLNYKPHTTVGNMLFHVKHLYCLESIVTPLIVDGRN